jgi:hypothetical protein
MHGPPSITPVRRQSLAWLLILLALPAVCQAQIGGSAADSTTAPPTRPDTTLAQAPDTTRAQAPDSAATLEGLGLENITLDPAGRLVVYENRRYRQSAEARGLAARRLLPSPGSPVSFYERRLGMAAAAVVDTGDAAPRSVSYPSDRGWTAPPR